MGFNYFSSFPVIQYQNNTCLDISARVALFQQPKSPTFYSPYQIPQGARADIVAGKIYGDPQFDWIMYLTNNIVDPYNGWPLNSTDYYNYITTKYGSIANAEQYILYWRTSWPIGTTHYPANWYNAQPEVIRKYFQPTFGSKNEILYYTQQKLDWRVSTNAIENWTISMDSGTTPYNEGDFLSVVTANGQVGSAQVLSANLTNVIVNQVNGNTSPAMAVTDFSNSSISNSVIVDTTVIEQAISLDEIIYWEPVTAMIFENEAQAYKSIINVLDPANSFSVYQSIVKNLQGLN